MRTDNAPPRARLNVTLLALNHMLFVTAAVTVMTLSGLVGRTLAPSPALATLPISAMTLGTIITALPVSMFMKRVGRRAGFLVGVTTGGFAGGVLCVIAIAAKSFWLFAFGNLLFGIYQAFAVYYRFAAAEVTSEAFRSRAISMVLAGGVIAAFLGPWNAEYGEALLPILPGAGPYLVIALLALASAGLLVGLRVPAAAEPDPAAEQRPLRQIARQPDFQVAVLCGAVAYSVMILLMVAAPLAMREAGFELGKISAAMQAHVLGMFAPSFVTGHLIARLGLHNVLFAGTLLVAGALAAGASGEAFVHFWSALVLLGVGWNFLFVGASDLLTYTHTAAERGKVQGFNEVVIFTLVALSSGGAGALLHYLGWAGLMLGTAPAVALTAAAILWLRRQPVTASTRVEPH